VHLHTTYSHDGVLSLDQLATFLRARGFDFMAVTEHSQDMSESTLAALEAQSQQLTTSEFLVIPGMEFTCTGTIHILGLGVTSACSSQDPSTVIEHIHSHGGVAVLAHPSNKAYPIDPAWVARLDGCEIWNNRQGKWLPQLHAIRKFEELHEYAPDLLAYAGLDLHGLAGYSHVAMYVDSTGLVKADVLSALRDGQFVVGNYLMKIPASGAQSNFKVMVLTIARSALNMLRRLRDVISGTGSGIASG
jgi:predicted metal-dependent phosphoesterase TrpH